MFCKSYTRIGTHNGKQMVAAELIAKTTPTTLPTTTAGIDNIDGDYVLGPGSSLVSTNPFKIHMMNDEFTWDEIKNS